MVIIRYDKSAGLVHFQLLDYLTQRESIQRQSADRGAKCAPIP
jgi:hypothetical protein